MKKVIVGYLAVLLLSFIVPFATDMPDSIENLQIPENSVSEKISAPSSLLSSLTSNYLLRGIENPFLARVSASAIGITVLYFTVVGGFFILSKRVRSRRSGKNGT